MIDTANYHDVLILNGGFRYDNYNIKSSGFGTVNGVAGVFGTQAGDFLMPNFNLGITWKPIPITSIYLAYATSSDPVGAEFDGTSANYGGLAPVVNGGSNFVTGGVSACGFFKSAGRRDDELVRGKNQFSGDALTRGRNSFLEQARAALLFRGEHLVRREYVDDFPFLRRRDQCRDERAADRSAAPHAI